MIVRGRSTSPALVSVAIRAGMPTFDFPHKSASTHAATEGVPTQSAVIAIKIRPSTVSSSAGVASRLPFIHPAKTIPTAPPGYNPHSAGPARGFVQSGLQ